MKRPTEGILEEVAEEEAKEEAGQLEEPSCRNCNKFFINLREGDSERCLAKKKRKKETDSDGQKYIVITYGKPNVRGKPCENYSPQIGHRVVGYVEQKNREIA